MTYQTKMESCDMLCTEGKSFQDAGGFAGASQSAKGCSEAMLRSLGTQGSTTFLRT